MSFNEFGSCIVCNIHDNVYFLLHCSIYYDLNSIVKHHAHPPLRLMRSHKLNHLRHVL